MNYKFRLNSFMWLAPFASFIFGYALMSYFYQNKMIEAPVLLGKTVDTALLIAAAHNIHLRVTDTKIDNDLPNGTIINQIPAGSKLIKENQTLYVTITQKPASCIMPDLCNKNEQEITTTIKNFQAKLHTLLIESNNAPGICIAQSPQINTVGPKEIFAYINKEPQKLVIMPDLKNKALGDVISFLSLQSITPIVLSTHSNHQCDACTILDQRPLAGTIINLQQKSMPTIQLQIMHQ